MERYEQISVIGEGSYGVVLKCRHRDSDQIVAVKKFLETEEDLAVRKMALREIRMLKKLRHENLVTMIDVFRHRKRFYLVFEYLEGTVLDELERSAPNGLGEEKSRERIYQVIRAVGYCHSNHIIHRDVKPENVLISILGVVKLCDFGFARLMSTGGEPCTEYVATRWYRAPELLVGEQNYTSAVDVWAIGCLFAEMLTGDPLFPGESDIDQLYLIVKAIGKPCAKHQSIMAKNSQMRGMIRTGSFTDFAGLYKILANRPLLTLDFVVNCLRMDPSERPSADDLLKQNYFVHDKFPQRFLPMLREKVHAEFSSNPLLRKFKAEILTSTDHHKDERVILRRCSQQDGGQAKWRMQMIEGASTRKHFYASDTSFHSHRKSYREKTGLTFLKSTPKMSNATYSNSTLTTSDNLGTIEKAIASLTTDGENNESNVSTSLSLTYNRQLKKSPSILQSVSGIGIGKMAAGQMPLLKTGPNKGVLAKRTSPERTKQDLFVNIEPLHWKVQNVALSNAGNKRKEKLRDDFSLPNLPGASISPKSKESFGRLNASPGEASIITPEERYSKAKRKYPLFR